MKEAKHSLRTDDWPERKDCIVADYCQNLALPHLGHSQPGETYYFSPLTVCCFGTADTATDKPQMRAYVYSEGDGKKGGNNVASLLFKDLHDRGWVDKEKGPREELTVVMDNCAGQNKNKMVLRMLALVTELGIYKRVNVAFLVAGHTKNICDRLFNLLKLVYRKSNLFGMHQLLGVLNTAEDVTAIGVKPKTFMIGKLWKTKFTGISPVELSLKTEIKPHLKELVAPGITPIKQFELWNKWRDFIPIEFRDLLCEKPTDEAYAAMKKTTQGRNDKAKMKRAAKRKRLQSNDEEIDQPSNEAASVAVDPSTQNEENERERVTPPDQSALDSVTASWIPLTDVYINLCDVARLFTLIPSFNSSFTHHHKHPTDQHNLLAIAIKIFRRTMKFFTGVCVIAVALVVNGVSGLKEPKRHKERNLNSAGKGKSSKMTELPSASRPGSSFCDTPLQYDVIKRGKSSLSINEWPRVIAAEDPNCVLAPVANAQEAASLSTLVSSGSSAAVGVYKDLTAVKACNDAYTAIPPLSAEEIDKVCLEGWVDVDGRPVPADPDLWEDEVDGRFGSDYATAAVLTDTGKLSEISPSSDTSNAIIGCCFDASYTPSLPTC
eukprot:scaffold1724_cov158-Amphora_coffeaeformis.AAC.6